MAILPLKKKPDPAPVVDTPEMRARSYLADLNENCNRVSADLETARERQFSARATVEAAEERVEAAQSALAEAKEGAARAMASGQPQAPVKHLREVLIEAQDELEIARQAAGIVKADVPALEARLNTATSARKNAIGAVVSSSAAFAELLADLDRLEREYVEKIMSLQFLVSQGYVAGSIERGLDPRLIATPATLHLSRYQSPPSTWAAVTQAVQAEASPAWSAAMTALVFDANARLPGE